MLNARDAAIISMGVSIMDAQRKKELMREYKSRKPEMGIVSFRCTATGESFLMGSKDTKADINSNRFQLELGSSYNRPMQALWNEHGGAGFDISVPEVLDYDKDDLDKDYSEDLEILCQYYLEKDIKARRLKP